MMRMSIGVGGLALALAIAAPAEARRYLPNEVYAAYCGAPPTREVNRAYDWALNNYRTSGNWLDGGVHGGWKRGQHAPANIARGAPTIDWCEAHLFTPGENNRWVRVGDDYLEISRYTGRIETVALAYVRQGYLGGGNEIVVPSATKRQYVRVLSRPKPKAVNYEK